MKSITPEDGTRASDLNVATLRRGDVHAWLFDLCTSRRRMQKILSPAEQDRAAHYCRAEDGERFRQARIVLRLVLARHLDIDPGALQFVADRRGRLRLAGPKTEPQLDFSLSGTADVALVAVSRSPTGADVERVDSRPRLRDLARSLYPEAEIECLAAGCGGSWLRGFYRHWTAREAYLKATGEGLAGLRTVQVACGPPAVIRQRGQLAADWVVSTIDFSPRHVATVVGASPVSSCRWLEA